MLNALAVFLPLLALTLAAILIRKNKTIAIPSQKNDVLLAVFCVTPILIYGLIFIGFRPENAGFDTPIYLRAYRNIGHIFEAHSKGVYWYGNTELLWWPIQSAFRYILNARSWLILNYALTCIAIYLAYKTLEKHYQINPLIFPLVLFTYYFVYMGNGIRQALALPIALAATVIFSDKKYIKSVLLISLAIGLHWSSILFLLIPAFRLSLIKKDWVYLAIPCVALALSTQFGSTAGWAINLLGVDALSTKHDLYFASDRESHVGVVWKTLNFWVCAISTLAFLTICKPSKYKSNVLHCYLTFFISIIFFGINIADFSERYMPAILLTLPITAALLTKEINVRPIIKNSLLLLGFLLMGIAVFFNKSAQVTLGYTT
ncbi:EpsG family protein [Pseudomonas laurylsulfatiphila]